MIGKLADVNVWDRVFTDEEMEKATNCMEIVPSRGNLINDNYEFEIPGSLVTVFDIPDLAEVSCKNMKYYLHIPVRAEALSEWNDICNKIEINSIAPKVEKPEDYLEFYNSVHTLPAFRKRCWHGSRMMHWFPYIKKPNQTEWVHFLDGSGLGFQGSDGWCEWIEHKEKDSQQCSQSYMGPAQPIWNQTLALADCSDKGWHWAPCFSCTLMHAHHHSVVLTLSGICDKSAFDKYYHLENDKLGYFILYGLLAQSYNMMKKTGCGTLPSFINLPYQQHQPHFLRPLFWATMSGK